MPTVYHSELLAGVERLRSVLLPAKFEVAGVYSNPDEVNLKTASFVLLVHAEIESYLEDIASFAFQKAWEAWCECQMPSTVIVSLLAFSGREHDSPPKSLNQSNAELDSVECIKSAQNVWRANLKKNHGLKEENLLRLFLPLGISIGTVKSTLFSDLTSFGASRGGLAHVSSRKIKTALDPETEYKRAVQLVQDLEALDLEVIKSRVRCDELLSVHRRDTATDWMI